MLVHRGGRGQSFVYELLYDGGGTEGEPFLSGLIDVAALRDEGTTPTSRGPRTTSRGREGEVEGPSSPYRAATEPPSRMAERAPEARKDGALLRFEGKAPENAV